MALVTMKKAEFMDMMGEFAAYRNRVVDSKFLYGIRKNIKTLRDKYLEIYNSYPKPDDDYMEYNNKRVEILKDAADKDENGEVVMVQVGPEQSIPQIPEDKQEEVGQKIIDLKEKYKEAIEKMEKKDEEYRESLEEHISVELFKIHIDHFPPMTEEQQDRLDPLIKTEY